MWCRSTYIYIYIYTCMYIYIYICMPISIYACISSTRLSFITNNKYISQSINNTILVLEIILACIIQHNTT